MMIITATSDTIATLNGFMDVGINII
jgi:hypothetical protein